MPKNQKLRILIDNLVRLSVLEAESKHDDCYTYEWCQSVKTTVKRELPKIKAAIDELLKGC